ncbi:MAG: M48 family metallopeptidase [Betaproteobacteria bacterium]|nr:M48 family metallopeptidase [Betaproteobacteria bacterium]
MKPKFLTAAVLMACGLLATSGSIHADGLPELGDAADTALPEPQERALGKRIMQEIHADRSYIDDAELNAYINGLGNRLIAASRGTTNDNRRDFEFFLLNDDAINAFALPGGFIGVHSGLLLASSSESELAGVLGHEISHVFQRHLVRGLEAQKNNSWKTLAALATALIASRSNSSQSGQVTEAAIVASTALQYQSQLDYSREFEREADRLGIQVMQQAGFDPTGMVGFFERLQKANRHNDGKTPGYLRTHPLTTERIADMQSRVDSMGAEGKRSVPDSLDYRLSVAKLRVLSMGASDAVPFFRAAIAERTIRRDRADVYGLALALTRMREFAAAEKELATIRANTPSPWVENLSAEILVGQRKWDEALARYKSGMRLYPQHRALLYGYLDTLYLMNQVDAALATTNEQLSVIQDDPKLFDYAAKGYELKKRKLAQHRAIGEAYFRRDNLRGAIDQLEIAVKARDGDFYEISSAEARLKEFRSAFKSRVLLPGEKREERQADRDPPSPRDFAESGHWH